MQMHVHLHMYYKNEGYIMQHFYKKRKIRTQLSNVLECW